MYDVSGNPSIEPRNVMTEFNSVVDHYPMTQGIPQNYSNMQVSHNMNYAGAHTMMEAKILPASERAIQESQLAVQREYEKQRKLQEFQKKTKKAAKNYGENIKTEAQIRMEQEKIENEKKLQKKKEFEEKLKNMRQNMKTKPKSNKTETKNSKPKSEEKPKNTIAVRVHKPGNNYNKENLNFGNRVWNNSKVKKPFGATTM